MVGVLDAIGAETAVIAGARLGAPVAWRAALLRRDQFRAVIGLGEPVRPRRSVRPTSVIPRTDDTVLSIAFPGAWRAEADLEGDIWMSVRGILLRIMGETAPRGGPVRSSYPTSI